MGQMWGRHIMDLFNYMWTFVFYGSVGALGVLAVVGGWFW